MALMTTQPGLPDDAACWCTPPEFVRPRFFFGQRLGVVDFTDWLWYHAGKQRFHGIRAHGAGILCGLRVDRYMIPNQDLTTLLRVHRGAALDACGREVIVGVDQCIDVAAWYLQQREQTQIQTWEQSGDRRLYVGLRYLECPSDPVPAPRDPCGCDAGGCDTARVREGFEMRLFTPGEIEAQTPAAGEAVIDLQTVLAAAAPLGMAPRSALEGTLHKLVAADCPLVADESWLFLGSFEVELQDNRISDLQRVDNAIPQRRSLLSTAALQELILALAAAGVDEGWLGPGPHISSLRFQGTGTSKDAGDLTLGIALAPAASGTGSVALNEKTFHRSYVQVRRLDAAAGWTDANPDTQDTVEYRATPEPHLFIEWKNDLQAGHYMISLITPPHAPIVDEDMHPLRPLRFACRFELTDQSGILTIAKPQTC